MTEIDSVLDTYLFRWYEWSQGAFSSLGYPANSPIKMMLVYGMRPDRGPPGMSAEIPQDVQIVDAAMLALKQFSENLYQSILVYLHNRTGNRSRAKMLRISVNTFQYRLKQGRCFLAGRLLNFEDGH